MQLLSPYMSIEPILEDAVMVGQTIAYQIMRNCKNSKENSIQHFNHWTNCWMKCFKTQTINNAKSATKATMHLRINQNTFLLS